MTTRTYTKTKRATKEQETHQKIIDAAIGLYGSVGPAGTTISAVATNASVQRLTVYRHFPKEADLIAGALAEWFDANPMPGPNDWRDEVSMENWPIAILSMLYGYYSETSVLWRGLLADRGKFDELDKFLDLADMYLAAMQDDMMRSLPTARRNNALCQAVVSHSVQFSTWQSFSDSQLDTVEIAALMEDWVQKCPLG
ncbi:MAG: TetR family transcriptional regulator [Thalassospira sp.]|uniref:TetR/AcrR family transcriptional regulator n=1 Tax=Thalassospira sp. TaxID=1912094 RepID=UPI0032EAD535